MNVTQEPENRYHRVIAEISHGGYTQRIDIPASESGVTDEAENLATQVAAAAGGQLLSLRVADFFGEDVA